MTIRKTCKWLLILVVLAAAGGGGYAFHLWNESNERIRTAVLAKCAEIVPDWDISLGRARFDWNRRVHLYDFTLKARGQSELIVSIPEIVVHIDRQRFAERQEVVVQKVRLLGPMIDLIRDPRGRWNFQELTPPPRSKRSLPEVEIEQAIIRVRLDQVDGSPAATLGMQNANFKLVPSGKRRFLVQGLTQVSEAGKLAIDGSWDIDQGIGWFNGRMRDVSSRGELSGLVIGSSPELRVKLSRMQAAIDDYVHSLAEEPAGVPTNPFLIAAPPDGDQFPMRTVSLVSDTVAAAPAAREDGVPNLGASANLDVEFKIAVRKPSTEPEFEFRIDVKEGHIDNEALPFPLRGLTGHIFWNNQRFVLRDVTARNGMTRVSLDGRFVRDENVSPGRLDFSIASLMLDERLRSRLPASARRIYDSLHPAGVVDLEGSLLFDGVRVWQSKDVVLTFRNCTGSHEKFPYPVENIQGTITQRGEVFHAELTGEAGRRPATLTGEIRNPGPEAETHFAIHVERLPVDEMFVAACRPAMQKTLASLNLEGDLSGDILMHRPPGLDQKTDVRVTATMTDANMEFVKFPYRLTRLRGDISYSSATDAWRFENLSAEHGTARLRGTASFIKREEPGVLDLTIVAQNAELDRQLREALTPTLKKAWDQLSPGGRLNLVSKIHWVPGQSAEVALPEAAVTGGEITLQSLPYPLEQVEAAFSYADGQVDIESFTGRHDGTKVRTTGTVAWTPGGEWRVRLEELFVDDLIPDRLFRRALPSDLRTVVEELDPAGPISLNGMVEIRGTGDPRDPVTAGWDVETIHSGGKLTTGIDLEKVHGRLTSRGTWDGRQVDMQGTIDLDSVMVRDYQFTEVRGPFTVRGSQVYVGSRRILFPDDDGAPKQADVPPEERVTARAIGGVFTVDAAVALLKVPSYRVKLTMSQGRLEEYARRYMAGAKNLKGIMDGWVDVGGRGSSTDSMAGRGRLRINPAALYELPVVVQIVNSIGTPDKTAFRYALLDFNIANSKFLFNTIDLVGDAISLRGRGSAGFDGKLNLDFYSMLPRNSLNIPIVSAVVGEATKGWVGVSVRGTTRAPRAKVTAVPQVDETLKRFLGAFGTGPPVNVPRLFIPPVTAPPRGRPARQTPSRNDTRRQTPLFP